MVDTEGVMLEFRTKTLTRYCTKCGRAFKVAPTQQGYRQSCLFCGVPLVNNPKEVLNAQSLQQKR